MPNAIETPRLLLRPFDSDDAEAAFGWFSDPVVMKYLPNGPDTSLEQTAARLAKYRAHQAAHGFSKWIVVDRESGSAIGDSGLLVLEEEGWVDLGFRLVPRHWGKGLATEMASAWVRVAFEDLGLEALGAFAHVDNAASIRVLEKLGFQPIREGLVMGIWGRLFGLKPGQHVPG